MQLRLIVASLAVLSFACGGPDSLEADEAAVQQSATVFFPPVVLPPPPPDPTVITSTSPRLYILVHGMSHPFDSADPTDLDRPELSRAEWGVEFLQGLLGGGEPSGPGAVTLFNFTGQASASTARPSCARARETSWGAP